MHPIRYAAIISGAFLAASLVYILGSDSVARWLTAGADQLDRVQTGKGVAYVTVVAAGLFALTYTLVSRIERERHRLQLHREQLMDAERRTLAGTLAATIAHDVNNLVSVIKGNLDFALGSEQLDEGLEEALADSQMAVEELMQLNGRLQQAARREMGEPMKRVKLSELVTDSIRMIRTHSKLDKRTVELDVDPDIELNVYAHMVTHALVNLTLNAAEATQDDGRVCVSLERGDDAATLIVEDDGPGIAPEDRDTVVRPFETSKESGTGLGLFSVVYCAEVHRGAFEIGDSAMGGAKMVVRLPDRDSGELDMDAELLATSGQLLASVVG